MQTPLIITHSELPTRPIVDYAALAELVRELGDLLLPLDTPSLDSIRSRLSHYDIFSRLWVEGETATHMLLTTRRTRCFKPGGKTGMTRAKKQSA
jgi:hypothetical protein